MSHNTWIHRFTRIVLVKPLVGSAIRPNHLTTLRLVAGLSAATMLAAGSQLWSNIGAGVFLLAMLLDRADGDYARLTGQTSASGHTYDLISDGLCNALIFIGLGVGLRHGEYGMLAIPMGLFAGAAVGTILWLVIRIENLEGSRAAELGNFAGFDPDDAMVIIPVAIWFDRAEDLLFAAAVGAPGFAIFFYRFFRRKLADVKTAG